MADEDAYELISQGRSPLRALQRDARASLRGWIRDYGAVAVVVQGIEDACMCHHCRPSIGTILAVDEALKTLPVPHRKCRGKIAEGGHAGWCRCSYSPLRYDELVAANEAAPPEKRRPDLVESLRPATGFVGALAQRVENLTDRIEALLKR